MNKKAFIKHILTFVEFLEVKEIHTNYRNDTGWIELTIEHNHEKYRIESIWALEDEDINWQVVCEYIQHKYPELFIR